MWIDDVKEKTPLRFTMAASRPFLPFAALASFAVVCAATADTLAPYAFKRIIDAVVGEAPGGAASAWRWVSIYLLLSIVLSSLFYRVSGLAGMRWSVGFRATATHALSSYITRHSIEYFSKRFAGAIGGKIGNASQAGKSIIESFLWEYLNFLVTFVVSVFLLFTTHLYVALLFSLWLFVIVPLNVYLGRKRVPRSAAAQREDTRTRARIIDVLTNIIAIHDFARRGFELEGIKDHARARYKAGLKNWRFGELAHAINNLAQLFFVGVIMAASVYFWNEGFITPGDLVLVLTLVIGIQGYVFHLGYAFNQFAEHYGEMKEALEEVFHPHEVVDIPFAPAFVEGTGEIVFKDVGFKYGETQIFSDLSLRIAPGEKVGLVGRSGAGKSTLIKLLTRQYDVTRGKILIDGQNIAAVSQESLREGIALVPQEPLLFHRTLRENIGYGHLTATEEEIRKAAKLAQAHDFIEHLPQKYETLVGERGIRLSGGERQRVAIARSFLKNAKILLLDEATSSLDSGSEAAIQKALYELMKRKTVIAIAHRLSTLRAMDRIIVLDGGTVVEDGTHEELLRLGGIYAELWSRQAGGFLQDN